MDVIRAIIEAYNDHDLERCLMYYVPEVHSENADGKVLSAQECTAAWSQGQAMSLAEAVAAVLSPRGGT
jgi:hypothetical protein